ncbi:hypothetical protein Tco_0379150 [Tanacetum coccineum]
MGTMCEPTVRKLVVETSEAKASADKPKGNPQQDLQEKGVIDNGYSRHMTGNMSYLTNFEEIEGGYVAFGGNPKGRKITGSGTIKTGNLDFENVYFAKIVNGEVQLQALVDWKKVIITESTVRRDLHLEDPEGVDCLPNATIFEQLTLMGYEKLLQKLTFYKVFFSSQWKFLIHTILQCLSAKTTALSEFSSTMASAIICLATNPKFNFSKYIFESMVKNLDSMGNFLMYLRKPRKDTQIPQSSGPIDNVEDEVVNEEMDDSLERAATTATSLYAEQDRGNINKTQFKATPNEPSSPGTSSGGVNTPQSDEDSLKLKELMELCTNLQNRVIDLEKSKMYQAQEIISLKRRVRRIEKKGRSRTHKLKRLYKVGLSARVESSEDEGLGKEDASKQGRIDDIDANEDIYLVNVHRDEDMFGVNDLEGDEVIVETEVDHEVVVETEVAYKDVSLSVDEVTLAQALAALKSAKPKAGKVMLQEPEQEERLAREKDEANVALTKERNDIQAKIDADYQLAQRLQAQEQEELTDEDKTRLFVQLLEQRRKHFATKRAEEKRNRPPTRAQQRSIMCTYLKNMEGWKPKSLKSKSFANIQELFDKAFKRVNTFVDYRTELVEQSCKKSEVMEESSKKAEAEIAQESSSKRAGEELEQESSKKQKVEEDKESEELKQYLEIIPDDGDDVTIDATPLSTKSPTIVDYKIYKEGKKSYF